MQDYDEALRLKPDDPDSFGGRGLARFARGDLEGALQDYNEALRLKPDFPIARGKRDEARQAIDSKSKS